MKIQLLGASNKDYLETQLQIIATAGKLSRFPGNVFEVLETCSEQEKNLKLIERIIKMGHESITDHQYLVFAIQDVSPIIEQTIIEERFCSFTIKSRREVDFSKVGYVIPKFRNNNGDIITNNDEMTQKYVEHMQSLFNDYSYLQENGISKEDARFVLPYSYYSNIIMGIDAHILKNMIINFTKGKNSNIAELKEFGLELLKIAQEYAPYLLNNIEKEQVTNANLIEKVLDENNMPSTSYKVLDRVNLTSRSENMDDTIFISALMKAKKLDYQLATYYYELFIKNNRQIKDELILALRDNFTKDELKQINMNFEIPVSFASLTHLTRHRTVNLLIPDFVPNVDLLQYKVPASIERFNPNFYHDVYKRNNDVYQEFKKEGICEEDLIYFTLSGNMVNVLANFDGNTLKWVLSLRTCEKAQWEIRDIANQIKTLTNKESEYYTKLLGPKCETHFFCPEGKESCGRIGQVLARRKEY